jgi:hypothetical protein
MDPLEVTIAAAATGSWKPLRSWCGRAAAVAFGLRPQPYARVLGGNGGDRTLRLTTRPRGWLSTGRTSSSGG